MTTKTLEDVKREHIELTLLIHLWNISAAARALDINRRTCQRYIERYGLKRPETPEPEPVMEPG